MNYLVAEDQNHEPHRTLLSEGSKSDRYKLYENWRKEVIRIQRMRRKKYRVTYDNVFSLMASMFYTI